MTGVYKQGRVNVEDLSARVRPTPESPLRSGGHSMRSILLGRIVLGLTDSSPCMSVAPTYPGNRYSLNSCTNILAPDWQPAVEFTGAADGSMTTTPLPGEHGPTRFFRVWSML